MIEPIWINTVILVLGLAVGYGKFAGKVAMKKEVEEKLYSKDGTTIFVPRSECREDQAACTLRIEKKLDGITASLKEHDLKHEAISEFIGFTKGRGGGQ